MSLRRAPARPPVRAPLPPAGRHAVPGPGGRTGWAAWLVPATLVLGPACGVLLVGTSYRASIAGASGPAFAWFWLGMACGYLPLALHATGRSVPDGRRQLALAALAAFTFVPKYLRNAAGPLYFDERAHWVQVRAVAAGHHLFVPNDGVPVIRFYPGLHALTVAVADLTGLSAWTAGEIVVAAVHVLGALGVYLIARTMMPARGAAIAAVVYVTNPEWVYFDTQFAYESLGVTLVLWTLYLVARLDRARSRADRARWAALASTAGSACVVTHHLSSVSLCAILLLCAGAAAVPAALRRGPWARALWLAAPAAAVSAVLAGYLVLVAPETLTYLGSSGSRALHELTGLLGLAGTGGRDTSRTPFSGSRAPVYERLAAFAAPLLVAALVGAHLLSRHGLRRDHRRGLALPASLLACAYVGSIPLVLTSAGSEPARRSWAFTYVGVAVVAGWAGTRALRGPRRRGAAVLAVGMGVVLCVGNLAAGENVAYRFPGPYLFGSDARSVTVDMLAARRWWQAVRAPGTGVVADRYNGVLYQAVPGARVATAEQGPIMDFYLTSHAVTPWFARTLGAGGYDYLVIDKNITRDLPLLGVYFAPDEPTAVDGPRRPVDPAIIDRWARSPYTTRVYDSDGITIYRLAPGDVSGTWR